MIKINLGCGLQCPPGWINIDNSMGVKLASRPLLKGLVYLFIPAKWNLLPNVQWPANTRWMDMTRPFPFGDNSVDVIYSSHTFEHLTYEQGRFAFGECVRILKPGGIIRIVVPDFEQLVNAYIANRASSPMQAALKFHRDSGFFEIPVPDKLSGMITFFFRRKNNHSFLYDEAALRKQFADAGLAAAERKQYGQSRIAGAAEIDIESRFRNAICLEALKP